MHVKALGFVISWSRMFFRKNWETPRKRSKWRRI